jgi:hypothetical protein
LCLKKARVASAGFFSKRRLGVASACFLFVKEGRGLPLLAFVFKQGWGLPLLGLFRRLGLPLFVF